MASIIECLRLKHTYLITHLSLCSFICARDMKGLYDKKIVERSMFIGEFQNNGDSNTLTRFLPHPG